MCSGLDMANSSEKHVEVVFKRDGEDEEELHTMCVVDIPRVGEWIMLDVTNHRPEEWDIEPMVIQGNVDRVEHIGRRSYNNSLAPDESCYVRVCIEQVHISKR